MTDSSNENVASEGSNDMNDSVVYISTTNSDAPMRPEEEEQNGGVDANASSSVHLAKGKPTFI